MSGTISDRFITIDHHAMQFFMAVDKEKLWERDQENMRKQLSLASFIENAEKEYINADDEQKQMMDNNAEIFVREFNACVNAEEGAQHARSIILNEFYNQQKVLAICYAALMSELVPAERIYQDFLDAMSISRAFSSLNGLLPCGKPPEKMH